MSITGVVRVVRGVRGVAGWRHLLGFQPSASMLRAMLSLGDIGGLTAYVAFEQHQRDQAPFSR